MSGIFDTGIFDSGIFDTPATVGTFDTGIFDRNIYDNVLGPVTVTSATAGNGYWLEVKRPKYKVHPEYDTDAKPKRKRKKKKDEGQEIVLAPNPVIERHIISVYPAWDAMAELQRIADQAALEHRIRLMALLRADDEWLMSL